MDSKCEKVYGDSKNKQKKVHFLEIRVYRICCNANANSYIIVCILRDGISFETFNLNIYLNIAENIQIRMNTVLV